MALSRPTLAAPRRVMLSFVLLLLLPAGAVVWLGVQLVRQDADLAARQRRERLEIAADRIVAHLEHALAATDRGLDDPARASVAGDDVLVVTLRRDGVDVSPPGRLLYYPAMPEAPAEPTAAFAAGEALEFQANDFANAAAVFRELARSPLEPVRAGALVRAARNLRKLGRHDAALDAYERLAAVERATVAGLPADLAARRARGALLHDLRRSDVLQHEARALRADLLGMRWRIDRAVLTTYLQQIEAWTGLPAALPPEHEAPASLVESLWQEFAAGQLPAAGRRASWHADGEWTALWRARRDEVVALAAGPRFTRREWLDPAVAATPGMEVQLVPADVDPVQRSSATSIRRRPGESGLPWTLAITDRRVASDDGMLASRRRMLLAGLSLLVVIVAGGGYFVARAVGREFAVARLQTDFVAAVSHEFRTPLTSLQQFTMLLSEADGPTPEKRRSFYQAQSRGIERLSRLVESLLDFGRMEAGARAYHLEPLDVGSLVTEVVREFREHAAGVGFTIACRTPDRPIVVRADAEALARAVWNLLDNAVKYSGTGRAIEVAVDRAPGSVHITVRDEGVGIPHHEQRDIFEKFVRGESSRAYGIKGTGIGLAMVRHIVAAHGGTIGVNSEPGRGSAFTIELPAEEGI